MDFLDKQIAPPGSWVKFEDLCRALFARIWKDPMAQKNGRAGQSQHGVDVYGSPRWEPGRTRGVQCKGKNAAYGAQATRAEVLAELALAESFEPRLSHWTFATTAPNDEGLQAFVRTLSEQRVADGKFPVVIIGWETIVALMAENPTVIEQFYPEHGVDLPAVIAAIRSMPTSAELAVFRQSLLGLSRPTPPSAEWTEVTFTGSRDLGPALMGRPLGPADTDACPELPEAAAAFSELERAFSARLTGVAGAGKSVCALQAARKAFDAGWRVVTLRDPLASRIDLTDGETPTLHLIDDAHLVEPGALVAAEQSTAPNKWLLTTHTSSARNVSVGSIRLDAQRAVRVIASSLRARRQETLAVVGRIDPRVSDRPLDESLDHRLDEAARADFPWQFCFILGGGWQRAGSSATAAREAKADLVLAGAAIRQIASRDAPCRPDQLRPWTEAAGIPSAEFDAAVRWLVDHRLLISPDDLRCPHQRFAAVILGKILEGQSKDGRAVVGALLGESVADPAMPLAGLSSLLLELRMAGHPSRWVRLLGPDHHPQLIRRCWSATGGEEVRGAAFVLAELQHYVPGWPARIVDDYRDILVGWLGAPPEGAGYAIGGLLGQISQKDEARWRALIDASDAAGLAGLVSRSTPERAAECAAMAKSAMATRSRTWSARFAAALDRTACLELAAAWPESVSLWPASELCQLLTYVDQPFGLDVIEALLPAIAVRQAADPVETYRDLRDTIWHSLRLDDTLGIYTGINGPTPRMKEVGRKLAAAWRPRELGHRLSITPKREFQSAAFLLNFLLIADRRRFKATVAALDWERIDQTIGEDWGAAIHDVEVFLAVCHASPAARPAIAGLIERNMSRLGRMSTRLALMSPETGRRHVGNGGVIALTSEHFVEWGMGAGVLADFAEHAPQSLDALLRPHEAALAKHLSAAPSPPFFEEAIGFLRVLWQTHPRGFERILDQVTTKTASVGWANALSGKAAQRAAGAFLVHLALLRPGPVGQMAKSLRARFPKASVPPERVLRSIYR